MDVVIGKMTMVQHKTNGDPCESNSRFTGDSDEELLLYMAERETNPSEARCAWEEFYRRHARYVLWICRRVCRSMCDDDTKDGIVIDTFGKVYLSADTYKCSNLRQPDEIRRRVRSWLGVIARNAALDVLRGQRDSKAVQLESEEWERIDDKHSGPVSKDTEAVRAAMEEVLDVREAAVLQMTYMYYNPDTENQRLPEDVVVLLCQTFHTTPANLRRIRKKATEKMRAALMASGYKDHKNN